MCYLGSSYNRCYECGREFAHRPQTTPCREREQGRLCNWTQVLAGGMPVVHSDETCAGCREARRAEEACSQLASGLRPLCLGARDEGRRMRAIRACCHHDLETRRARHAHEAAEQERRKAAGLPAAEGRADDDEELKPAPMLVTARHQAMPAPAES
ncbi:hypothetical protein GGR56DRAFT_680127 [Xylariaceae sp. FL0804]|nr:hypothetical protein GGR56DRAFT_680127 [Xylariaceae sp. FL0804]